MPLPPPAPTPVKVFATNEDRQHLIFVQRLHRANPKFNAEQLIGRLEIHIGHAPSNLVIRNTIKLVDPHAEKYGHFKSSLNSPFPDLDSQIALRKFADGAVWGFNEAV
ncbi:hypothetical protein F5Y19DRAFT_474470 [Xylariaceae sp. FL1651]|nr:hypothetical protein F5Y19DRAFT_474470 [Xylariaceae sp. FL1651]